MGCSQLGRLKNVDLAVLAHTFLVGLLNVHDLPVVSGSHNLNQGVLICPQTLKQGQIDAIYLTKF